MTHLIIDGNPNSTVPHPAVEALGLSSEAAQISDETITIAVVNLMPTAIHPIHDFGRLILGSNQSSVRLIDASPVPETITSKADRASYRTNHMSTIEHALNQNPDALLVTGFGNEALAFEDVAFWDEVTDALDWAEAQSKPVLASCWASHAALYHHHDVKKTFIPENKISGVFKQQVIAQTHPLMAGIQDNFPVPVSRYGRSDDVAIQENRDLIILAQSDETGISIATDGRVTYLTGHGEYGDKSLPGEYFRDVAAGTPHLEIPQNVFVNDDPEQGILPKSWTDASQRFLSNWLDSVQEQKSTTQSPSAPQQQPTLSTTRGLVNA